MHAKTLAVFLTLLATDAVAVTYEGNLPIVSGGAQSVTYEGNLPIVSGGAQSVTYEGNLPIVRGGAQSVTYEGNLPLTIPGDAHHTLTFTVGAGSSADVVYATGWLHSVELGGCDGDQWVLDVDATVDLVQGWSLVAPEGIWCYAVLHLDEAFTAVIADGSDPAAYLIGADVGTPLLDAALEVDRHVFEADIGGDLFLGCEVDLP